VGLDLSVDASKRDHKNPEMACITTVLHVNVKNTSEYL